MHQLEEGPGEQLLLGVAEERAAGGVDALEVAVEAGGAVQIERDVVGTVETPLKRPPLDDVATDDEAHNEEGHSAAHAQRLRDLRDLRERARAEARGATGEASRRAGHTAQELSHQVRLLEPSVIEWVARSSVARASAHVVSALGCRPAKEPARLAWDRVVSMVGAYRYAHSVPLDESMLIGPRPSSAEARPAWDATTDAAEGFLRQLQRVDVVLERVADADRGRAPTQ